MVVCRIIQIFVNTINEAAKDQGNPCLRCITCCFKCCVDCCVHAVEHLNKNAYMATALFGYEFCPAARQALSILADNATTAAALKGATWIFELAGVGGLTAGGVYLTFLQLKMLPEYNDRRSDQFVSDPTGTLIVAGIACFIVSWP